MLSELSRVTTALIITITILAIISFPSFYKYFYRAGGGHAIREIITKNNISWSSMTEKEREPYISRAKTEGIKSVVFMTFGQYVPLYFFLIMTILVLSNSVSDKIKKTLKLVFVGIWIGGLFFLSIGIGYWGPAIPFPESLLSALIIYIVVTLFFGIIIGAGRLIQRMT